MIVSFEVVDLTIYTILFTTSEVLAGLHFVAFSMLLLKRLLPMLTFPGSA